MAPRPPPADGQTVQVAAEAATGDGEPSEVRTGVSNHPLRSPREVLADLAAWVSADEEADRYGDGGAVTALEERVAGLLGKPAAVLMPSGTMAQQIALRIWAEDAGTDHVVFHPLCHLELHEEDGYRMLHGLRATLLGERRRLIEASDLDAVPEPIAAILVELPQREIGGQLPPWNDLLALMSAVRERGSFAHLDGARLWECRPFYGREYSEIASLFDSVYVSLYKILGGLSGAVLAGPVDFVDRARVWRRRHGGTLLHLWPLAAAGGRGLDRHLDRIDAYCNAASVVGSELSALPGVRLVPDPPHTNMMHVAIEGPLDALQAAHDEVAVAHGMRLFRTLAPSDVPGWHRFEVAVGETALALPPGTIAEMTGEILALARAAGAGSPGAGDAAG